MADLHSSPKCGLRSSIKSQLMPWVLQKSAMTWLFWFSFKSSYNYLRLHLAPTKLVPWSLQSFPLLEMNLFKQAIKASKGQIRYSLEMYCFVKRAFTMTSLHVKPCLLYSGPALSTSTLFRNSIGCYTVLGKLSNKLRTEPLSKCRLQVTQSQVIDQIALWPTIW